jgi:septation ring formation regulator EzrA
MSIFDTDQAFDKIDYDAIYKKKFDEIESQLMELRGIVNNHMFDFRKLEANFDDIKSMMDFVMDRQNKLINALDILRIHLNTMLPDEYPKIYFNLD